MAGKMTPAGIARSAAVVGCDVPAMRAVLAVETLGDGFDEKGRPRILLERHKFYHLADPLRRDEWHRLYPDICNPKAGGYGPSSSQYLRLYRALQLDADAAVKACSWGIGQIMGFNYALTGEASLLGFVLAMHHDEDVQLLLMANFIRAVGAGDELARHDWAGFARIYNGPAYRRNAYDTKLAAAYDRHRRAGVR